MGDRTLVSRVAVGCAGVLVCVAAITHDAHAWPFREGPPLRQDLVARFSSGSVRVQVDSEAAVASVSSGWLSLSSDDADCVPAPGAPCLFSVNELRLRSPGFSIAGKTFEDVTIVNGHPAPDQHEDGSGLHVRPIVPFWVLGRFEGEGFGVYAPSGAGDVLDIVELVVSPTDSRATVHGRLSGSIGDHTVHLTLMASTDTPFLNTPPFAHAPDDVETSASCFARLSLPDTGTDDAEANHRSSWYEISGNSVGRSDAPILLPPGEHALTLVANDRFGGLGFDDLRVTVRDDGTSEPIAGAAMVSFESPAGTTPERFALLASRALRGSPRVETVSATGSSAAAVASLGSLELDPGASVGDAWAGGTATLANRVWIRGALHVGGEVRQGHDVRIDGGLAPDGPFTPGTITSYHVPLPSAVSLSVDVRAGDVRTLESGSFGTIHVRPGGELVLMPGAYAVRELDVQAGAVVRALAADGSPTMITVTDQVRLHAPLGDLASAPTVLLSYLGSNRVAVQGAISAWIVAPNAEITLAAARHRGAFVARDLVVRPGGLVVHEPLSWEFVRAARPACSLEPRVTCVRALGGGRHEAVFGYENQLPHYGAVVEAGPFNRLLGAPGDPPQAFLARGTDDALRVEFETSVTWILGGRTATATPEAAPCP